MQATRDTESTEAPMKALRLPVTEAEYNQLVDLANKHGKSLSQYILDAVSMQLWVDDALKDGGQVIAKRKHGKATVLTAKP